MIECDSNIDEIVNDVPVFPNEICSYIINLTLQSDVTMLRTINRVSKMFKELATTAMINNHHTIHHTMIGVYTSQIIWRKHWDWYMSRIL